MILRIKLLSDLCVSSGETYNSYVDTDVVYDEYGLPFIPAKRMKGCIREAALELVEWGLFDKQLYESLFGKEGKERTLFSLDNAYLDNYEEYIADLMGCEDKALVHPQRVLGLYTYTRTQTAMTKDGVADKGSLRTIRVVSKGNCFNAYLRENVKLSDMQKELLVKAISLVKHIGVDRTRGLGLVELSLLEEKRKEAKCESAREYSERNRIHYTITLKSPLLCKSAEGSQEKTHDYIEGSKVIGILAQKLSHDSFVKLMNHDETGESIIVSNAYISDGTLRYTPISASLQKVKDQTYDAENCMIVEDMLVPHTGGVQWTAVGHCYMNPQGYVKTVDTEVNYHHRRTDDKSIGKANGMDGSAFYQLESIHRGQVFSGYILANREQAPLVENVLNKAENVRMGYGRNAEYGNVEICVTGVEPVALIEPKYTKEFVVKLNSAAILYNDCGIPSADVECLKAYIADTLQVSGDDLSVERAFLNYENIGGFNVTWNRRKPIFTALGKGTVCFLRAKDDVDISRLEESFIGERVAEGYGEMEVSYEPVSQVVLRKGLTESSLMGEEKTEILSVLRIAKKREEVTQAGVNDANEMLEKERSLFNNNEIDAVLSKLILIVKNEKSLKDIKVQVSGIESKTKLEMTRKLMRPVEKYLENAELLFDQEEAVKVYLNGFLNQIKYVVYRQKKEGTR